MKGRTQLNGTAEFFDRIAEEYSLPLLNWAYEKLGDREKAEDLAQEVLLQVFYSIRKNLSEGHAVEKPHHMIWKIAHFVWCHYLRENANYKMHVPADDLPLEDGTDFASSFEDDENEKLLIAKMRRKISQLDALQREIIVSFYVENNSVKQIAKRLEISESSVKWHLYDTRKKLKKGIVTMGEPDFLYRPRRLHMGISGQAVPFLDTKVIEYSLTKQNICIACYQHPKSLDGLTETLGIPKAYLESDLKWLIEKEFITKEKSGYSTSFLIETSADEQGEYEIFQKHKEKLSDVIVDGLVASEAKIRKIDFYGSNQPLEKLLWLLIYRFANYQKIPYRTDEAPIRPDGGKYFPLGFDRTDFSTEKKVLDTSGWAYNGSMANDNFWWFGLYNFGKSEIEDMMDQYTAEWKKLHELLCVIIHSGYDISNIGENEKYILAKLVQKGFVRMDGDYAFPNFSIFTSEQYSQLEKTVFAPISAKLEEEIKTLSDDLAAYYNKKIPPQLKDYFPLSVRMALCDIGYVTTILAFNDGKLYVPKDPADGESLTLMYIMR